MRNDQNKITSVYPSFGNIAAGTMDLIINIQRNQGARTIGRDQVEDFQTIHAEIWAEKNPTGSREFLGADAQLGEVNNTWRIRHIDGLRLYDRILHGDEIHEIEGIISIGRKEAQLISTSLYDNVME